MPPSLKTLLPRALAVTFFVSMLGGHAWFSQRMAQLAAMPPPDDASFGWAADSENTYNSWVVPQREFYSRATYPSLYARYEDEHRPSQTPMDEVLLWNMASDGLIMLDGLKPWLRHFFYKFSDPSSLSIPPPLRQIGPVSMMMGSSKSGPVLPGWELTRLIEALSFDEGNPSHVSDFTFAWNFRDSVDEHSKVTFTVFDVAPETGMTWKHEAASSSSPSTPTPNPR